MCERDPDTVCKRQDEKEEKVTRKKKKNHGSHSDQINEEPCYKRAHLHRACKLVLQDSGECLFNIQRKMNFVSRPKRQQWPELPPEIWIKIFGYIVHERQYPFMINAPFVCKQWYNLCLDHSLWTTVRVPYGGYYWMRRTNPFLKWLARNRLAPCKEIDLSGWDITASSVEELAQCCPKLQVLNLSYCTKLRADIATYLTDHCPHITSLDFSHTCNDLVSVAPMTTVIERYNAQLINLNLSANLVHGFSNLMNAICENCLNLEVLCIHYCRVDVFNLDIERMQRSLLHLRILNMGYLLASSIRMEKKPPYLSPGFKSLEDLSIAVGTIFDNRHPLPVDDNFIERMILSSRQLKCLDIRGAEHYSISTLRKLPNPDFERLTLGIRSIDDPTGLDDLVKQWRHSLTELVLSYGSFSIPDVTAAVSCLVKEENPVLEKVELENLDVELPLIEAICQKCPNLWTVNLQKCMKLPQKLRRFFNGHKVGQFRHLVSYYSKHWKVT